MHWENTTLCDIWVKFTYLSFMLIQKLEGTHMSMPNTYQPNSMFDSRSLLPWLPQKNMLFQTCNKFLPNLHVAAVVCIKLINSGSNTNANCTQISLWNWYKDSWPLRNNSNEGPWESHNYEENGQNYCICWVCCGMIAPSTTTTCMNAPFQVKPKNDWVAQDKNMRTPLSQSL